MSTHLRACTLPARNQSPMSEGAYKHIRVTSTSSERGASKCRGVYGLRWAKRNEKNPTATLRLCLVVTVAAIFLYQNSCKS